MVISGIGDSVVTVIVLVVDGNVGFFLVVCVVSLTVEGTVVIVVAAVVVVTIVVVVAIVVVGTIAVVVGDVEFIVCPALKKISEKHKRLKMDYIITSDLSFMN